MLKQDSLVSIIVFALNDNLCLEECMKSICAQSYLNIEVIIIRSKDEKITLGALKELAYNDTNICEVIIENENTNESFNKAIDISKGYYIAFIDSSHFLFDNYIEKLVATMLEENSDLVVCENRDSVDGNFSVINTQILGTFSYNISPHYGKMLKKDIIIKHNIKFLSLCYYNYSLFYLSYLTVISKAYVINKQMYFEKKSAKQNYMLKKHYSEIFIVYKLVEAILVNSGYYSITSRNNAYYFIIHSIVAVVNKCNITDIVFLFRSLLYLKKIKHVKQYSYDIKKTYKTLVKKIVFSMFKLSTNKK